MKKLSSGARALLEQYRDEFEIHDQPAASVLERIESSIAQGEAPAAQATPRAAAWMAWGAVAAASVATVWVWTSRDDLRVAAPHAISSAVDGAVEQATQRPRVPERSVPAAPGVVLPTPAPMAPPTASVPHFRGRTPAAGADAVVPDNSLQGELDLLRQARVALREGRLAGATASLQAHALAYPQGQLAEERDALLVVVRCKGGKENTGRVAFERSHPGSHHLPSIRVACDSEKTTGAVTDGEGGGQ